MECSGASATSFVDAMSPQGPSGTLLHGLSDISIALSLTESTPWYLADTFDIPGKRSSGFS